MLTRSTQVSPPSEYYADSLLTPPSFKKSVFDNLAMGFATPIVALNMLDDQFAKKPEGQAIMSAFNGIRLAKETPGISWGQWLATEAAGMIGFALNPATWGLGEAGGFLARGITGGVARIAPDAASVFMRQPLKELVSKPIGEYIPSAIGKEGAEKTLSLGLISDKTLQTFGVFAGAGVPQGIVDNFNADTGHIAWGGVAREMGEMGAFGVAIGSVPFAYGVLRGKINRGRGNPGTDSVDGHAVDTALQNGHISAEEHAWYKDYLEHQKNPSDIEAGEKLKSRASEIINNNGHRANTVTNEAMFEILTPDDVSNLQGMISDQISGNVPEPYKTALSDFVVHNRLDYIRQNPTWLDGVRGYVDHINKKLEMKPSKIAEANEILDRHLTRGVKENMPFSQKELLKHMRKAQFEASHVSQLPVTVPENLQQHLKIAEKINRLEVKLKADKRQEKTENKQTLRRVAELEAKLPKILTPKEELTQLRQTLIGEHGLPKNWELSNAYHRLIDLSNVWHNARTLLDRVHLEHEYNRQSAFRDLVHQVLRIADSDTPRIAKPDDVVDYLKRRVEGNLNKVESKAEIEKSLNDNLKVPADYETILNEQELQIRNTEAESAKEEFNQSVARMKEFKSSEGIFKNLISCVMGGLGG